MESAMKHKELLLQAARTIDERGGEYGDMVETHKRIARLFNDMVSDVKLEAHHVAAVLLATKLARIYANPTHDDSYVDLAAYASFRSELVRADTSVQSPIADLINTRRNNDVKNKIDHAAALALKSLDDLEDTK
jgi:hypothetical protein